MNDTRPEATAVVREAIRRISPAERMRQALELSEQLRALSLTTLRRRHPDLSTLQLVELMTSETRVPTTAPRRRDPRRDARRHCVVEAGVELDFYARMVHV